MLTPRTAMEVREQYMRSIFSSSTTLDCKQIWYTVPSDRAGVYDLHDISDSAGVVAEYPRFLRSCDILIWEPTIYAMALNGAADAFMNVALPPMPSPFAQVWFFKAGHMAVEEEGLGFYLLPEEKTFLPFLCVFSDQPDSITMILPFLSLTSRKAYIRTLHIGTIYVSNGATVTGAITRFAAKQIAARLFLETSIASLHEEAPAPNVIKHWKKRGIDIPPIRTVLLRDIASPVDVGHASTSPQSHIEWSRRWIVRPHWRSQRVGPALSLTRPTFIGSHVKGPVDKPLILQDTVFVAKR